MIRTCDPQTQSHFRQWDLPFPGWRDCKGTVSGPWDNSAWVSPVVSASLSLCSTPDNGALFPIFFLLLSQMVLPLGPEPYFCASECHGHLYSTHCLSSTILTSWHQSPYLVQSPPKLSTATRASGYPALSAYSQPVNPLTPLGSVLILQPAPNGWGKGSGFRWSGSPASEWSSWHMRKGKKKKRPLLSPPSNGFMDQEWGIDGDWLARSTFTARREGKLHKSAREKVIGWHLRCKGMPHPGTEGEKQRCSLIKCLVVAQGDTQVGIYQQGATLSVDVTTGPRVGGSKAKNPLVYI